MAYQSNNGSIPPVQALDNLSLGGATVGRNRKKKHAYHVLDNSVLTPQPAQVPTDPSQDLGPPQVDASATSQRPLPVKNLNNTRYASSSDNANDSMSTIPTLTEDREYAQVSLGSHPLFRTFESACPPPACCEYVIEDQGISGPNFARLTMYNVPATEQLRSSTKLPLGMLVRPFAKPLLGSQNIAITDFSTTEPPRCRRCRAYMNPSMLFAEGGTRFVCNMCQFSNPVDGDYYQPTDAYNRRIDWQDRPELAFGTYDFAVPKEYWFDGKKPMPLTHLFAIDVSAEAIKKDLHVLAVEAIKKTLYDGSFPTESRVGIATFDRSVHFYNLSPNLEQAQMIVMSDVNDPFVPLEKGLFVNPEESRVVIEQLLDSVKIHFQENKVPEPAYGTLLDVAHKALEPSGGKLSVVLSSLPTWGPGNLYMRSSKHSGGSEAEKEVLKAGSPLYLEFAKKYAKSGVGMDLYAFPISFVDIANSGEISRATGGHIHHYPNFVPERDGRKFISDFVKRNTTEGGTQGLLKVRCSNGLQISSYIGKLYTSDSQTDVDPYFGYIDSNTTLGVLFQHDGKLDTKLDAHFQAALLYTSTSGQRRVRVINILASVSEQFKPVMNYIDIDACMGLITREALSKLGEKTPKEVRVGISDKLIQAFAAYRKHAGSSLPPSQLLMPIALRSFIIYGLSLLKTRALRDGQMLSDAVVHSKLLMYGLDSDELALYLYPRIIGLHNLRPDDCVMVYEKKEEREQDQDQESEEEEQKEPVGLFQMPENVRASMSAIEDGGVYLMYNGQGLLLYIHKLVNPNLLRDLFGPEINQPGDINPYINELPELNTEVSRQARALVTYFANQSGSTFLGIQLARQDLDGAEHEFASHLVEDRMVDTYSYGDFVAYIHRSVKQLIENGNTKATTQMLNETIALSHVGI